MDNFEQPKISNKKNITQLAYEYWKQNDCRHGHDNCDWLQAEAELEQKEQYRVGIIKKRWGIIWIASLLLLPIGYYFVKSIIVTNYTNIELLMLIALEIIGVAGFCFYLLPDINSQVKASSKNKLIESPRHVVGALIAILGTIIVFCPNIAFINRWYSTHLFGPLTAGMDHLSSFELISNVSEPTSLGNEKSLKLDGLGEEKIGYQDILQRLKAIDPAKINLTDNYEITNRRDRTIYYGTGQYIDTLNVIHVKDKDLKKVPILVTTEDRLRLEVEMYRNRWVEFVGTILIILGIFCPYLYLWQGIMYLVEQGLSKF